MAKRKWGGMVFSTNADLMEQLNEEEAAVVTLPPEQQRLTVRRDAKARKGKVVTLVEGFEGSDDDLQALAKKLKVACGTGGSAKDGEIIIQGEVMERVSGLLQDWGYTKTKRR
ncbi:MAG: translation initiation factor [Porphyromonas sp.]|nr:translation initiation factor [Porphyromonas sp.]